MSGTISSAQVRPMVEEAPKITKIEDGSVSSHDLLRQEFKPDAVVENESVSPEVMQQSDSVIEKPVEQSKQDSPNFRSLRQKAEQAERESRDKEEIIQRLLRQQQQMPSSFPSKQEDYSSDEILERKHLTPLEQRLERLEKENAQLKQYTASEISKAHMKGKYSDYDEVMTEDNLKDLEYMEPAIANTLKASYDFEGASKIAYNMIKSLGIHKSQSSNSSPSNTIEQDRKRIAENLAKPKPVNAIGKSSTPLGELSPYHREMTTERRDMLHNKVMSKMRRKKSF